MKKTLILSLLILAVGACTQTDKKNEKAVNNVGVEKGKSIAQQTFAALSGNLKSAMAMGGLEHAVSYCNVNAMPLTDSLSNHFNVTIKRVSAQYRNPKNKPDSLEMYYLVDYKRGLLNGKELQPVFDESGARGRFFAPILTKELCVSCHGLPGNEISESLYADIKKLYPDDQAIGFKAGDLRGMWSITFAEE